MSERIHALAQLLLGKTSLEECSIEELQQLTKRYPFFAPAQFLLLQKLKATDAEGYDKQKQKAVLYLHDPLQFEYFVNADKFYVDEETLLHQPAQHSFASHPDEADSIEPSPTILSEEQSFLHQDVLTTPMTDSEPPTDFSSPIPVDKEVEEETLEPAEETARTEQPEKEQTSPALPDDETSAADSEISLAGGNSALTEAESFATSTEATATEHPTSGGFSSPEQTNKSEVHEQHLESALPGATTNPPEEESATAVIQPTVNADAAPLFEPFHTVDYFASQGIKITADELPKDKLGKQLRSFTEWLKIMKRLPATEIGKAPQTVAEKTVENLASHSVEGSDVITEAMAEVWTKQGNREKAIETYNKLSLLNPSKKAYFAAKIENLKGS
jgi:hypothetical protein